MQAVGDLISSQGVEHKGKSAKSQKHQVGKKWPAHRGGV